MEQKESTVKKQEMHCTAGVCSDLSKESFPSQAFSKIRQKMCSFNKQSLYGTFNITLLKQWKL